MRDLHSQNLTARKRRHIVVTKKVWLFLLCVGLAVGGFYIFFYSPFFKVGDIVVIGLSPDREKVFADKIQQAMSTGRFGLKPYANIFLLNAEGVGRAFVADTPMVKDVKVKKSYLHGLQFNFVEREPIGIWCFNENCQYFDEDAVILGKALESTGFVYLTVRDDRDEHSIDQRLLGPVLSVARRLPGINVHANSVIISKDSLAEFRVKTSAGYDLIFSLDSDLDRQLEILRIFLDERNSPTFAPQYIDLRIDGRVYYK